MSALFIAGGATCLWAGAVAMANPDLPTDAFDPAFAAPAVAEPAVDYTCAGSLSDEQTRTIRVVMSVPREVPPGAKVDVVWSYADNAADPLLTAPQPYPEGADLELRGNIGWHRTQNGQEPERQERIRGVGVAVQPQLRQGEPLLLPELSGQFTAPMEEGEIELLPRRFEARLTPAERLKVTDDDDSAVEYTNSALWDVNDEGPWHEGKAQVLRRGAGVDAEADVKFTFKGTGIDYIGGKFPRDMAKVDVYLDGRYQKTIHPTLADGEDPEMRFGQVVWSQHGLENKNHVLELRKASSGRMFVDGFRVLGATDPLDKTTCTARNSEPTTIEVTRDATLTPTPTETDDTGSPTDPPRTTHTVTVTANPNPSTSGTVTSTPGGTPPGTHTATATATVTGPAAQVTITPKGGAKTGEAPVSSNGPTLLMAGGTSLMLGSALAGLEFRRRRGERDRGFGTAD
ncbi:hypothetical protein D5H75_20915 [Bailinhaonella thermotolerans]|uniref:Gram-positive cocci surface proteins LPxTG domain-containing protein n=2 Tax=Bailinhaonella thermotolerans TaxID=1070861 RepID=A0A3A4AP40_9ACTN|nr:hypothetical protein D5H75_20915 [Bailinhaonella thermotolerans]